MEAVAKSAMEEEYTNAMVSVWWYLENCDRYDEYDAVNVIDNISASLFVMNCKGNIAITCYGDTTRIPYEVCRAFEVIGIPINHIPPSLKDTIYHKIIVGMMYWAFENPAPGHYLLMLGDFPISYVKQVLQKRGFNIFRSQSQDLFEPRVLELELKATPNPSLGLGLEAVPYYSTTNPSLATDSDAYSTTNPSLATDSDKMEAILESESEVGEDYTTANVSVWWDLENWDAYKENGIAPCKIKDYISSALVAKKYRGNVSIFCYADTSRIPQDFQTGLGIPIQHFPTDLKDEKAVRIIVHMMNWSNENPAPATYLLISDNCEFNHVIRHLLGREYNILLALTRKDVDVPHLVAAAKSVWVCSSLLAGGSPISIREYLRQWVPSDFDSEQCVGSDSDSEIQTQQCVGSGSNSGGPRFWWVPILVVPILILRFRHSNWVFRFRH